MLTCSRDNHTLLVPPTLVVLPVALLVVLRPALLVMVRLEAPLLSPP